MFFLLNFINLGYSTNLNILIYKFSFSTYKKFNVQVMSKNLPSYLFYHKKSFTVSILVFSRIYSGEYHANVLPILRRTYSDCKVSMITQFHTVHIISLILY
jgi:hypothetical protein